MREIAITSQEKFIPVGGGGGASITDPTYRRDVTVREIEGETLVLDLESGKIHQFNLTASYIWHKCDGKTLLGEIAGLLAAEFDVDRRTAEQDVVATINKLRELQLLVAMEETQEQGHLAP